MSDVLDGPADTRMMGIVHSALRRDLERSRIVLSAGAVPDARRAALAEHLIWMMDFLHHHHEGEDNGLYPLVRAKNAALGEILDSMNSEHEAIVPAMDEVKMAARSWRKIRRTRHGYWPRSRHSTMSSVPTSSTRRRK